MAAVSEGKWGSGQMRLAGGVGEAAALGALPELARPGSLSSHGIRAEDKVGDMVGGRARRPYTVIRFTWAIFFRSALSDGQSPLGGVRATPQRGQETAG